VSSLASSLCKCKEPTQVGADTVGPKLFTAAKLQLSYSPAQLLTILPFPSQWKSFTRGPSLPFLVLLFPKLRKERESRSIRQKHQVLELQQNLACSCSTLHMPTKVNGYAARKGTNHSTERTVSHIDYSALTVQKATGRGRDILAIDTYRIIRFKFLAQVSMKTNLESVVCRKTITANLLQPSSDDFIRSLLFSLNVI